jgi:hypothetical protein
MIEARPSQGYPTLLRSSHDVALTYCDRVGTSSQGSLWSSWPAAATDVAGKMQL